MFFRKTLAVAGLAFAGLALSATTAFASTTGHGSLPFPNSGVGSTWGSSSSCGSTWGTKDDMSYGQDQHGCCSPVTTPWEPNYSWVTNTTGQTVTVTLYGKYFWVQTRDHGYVDRLGPTTTKLTLLPGEQISVAWYRNTGPHSWCWTGCERCVTTTGDPCGNFPGVSTDSYTYGGQNSCVPCKTDPNPCQTVNPQPCRTTDPTPPCNTPDPCKTPSPCHHKVLPTVTPGIPS
jgi:hypothetical protein